MISSDLNQHVLFTKYNVVLEICKPLELIDTDGFFYIRRFLDNSFITLSKQLDWPTFFLRKYLNGGYSISDVKDFMFPKPGVFLWDVNFNSVIYSEMGQIFQYGNGISICRHTTKYYVEINSFYSHVSNKEMSNFYLNNVNVLKKFCNYFSKKVDSVIQRANRLPSPEKYCKIKFMHDVKDIINNQEKIEEFFRKINCHTFSPNVIKSSMTSQELRCAKQCAEGKSAKQIAESLYISRRTVETHLANAKRKLNCANLNQLIAVMLVYSDSI